MNYFYYTFTSKLGSDYGAISTESHQFPLGDMIRGIEELIELDTGLEEPKVVITWWKKITKEQYESLPTEEDFDEDEDDEDEV